MTIRLKILLACLGMTVIALLLGAYSHSAQSSLGRVATGIYDDTVLGVSYLRSAEVTLARAETLWHRQGAAAGSGEGVAIVAVLPDVIADLDIARERALSPAARDAIDVVRNGVRALSDAAQDADPAGATAILDRVEADFLKAVEVYTVDGFRHRRSVDGIIAWSLQRTWIAVALFVGITLAISAALIRSVVPALRDALGIAQAIAAGRLDNPIIARGGGETAHLLRALGAMQASIAAALARIRALMQEEELNHAGQLAAQHARLDAALSNMNQGLCLFGPDGTLAVANRRFAEMFSAPAFGATPEQVLGGEGLEVLLAGSHGEETTSFSRDLPDGRTIAVTHRPVTGGGWVATYEDITERRASEARLVHMARHDALTGLPNRLQLREHMDRALARVRRGGSVAVLCLDLDRFKVVNDALGHPAGDALLCAVADRLRMCVRETDLVVRLGGDEFAVVQESAKQPAEASALAHRLIDVISAPFEIEGQPVVIGTSVGIALSEDGLSTPDALLKRADLALYEAKGGGRGTFRFFEAEMDAVMQVRRALEMDLRRTLAAGQFEVFYQPLVKTSGAGISGFEALLRWHHPKRGTVSPALFIPMAEEIGLIGAIGEWVLRQACADAASWPGALKVAVNLSPAQFRGRSLAADVEAALAASGLPPERLELEITESVLLQDDDAVLDTLHALRALGVRISMDDFGTGYSSLSYLRRFPFDKIKIDQSFVRGMSDHEDCIAIVRAVVGLGRSLNMMVNAEGVETPAQLAALRAEGCGEVQGYLFSKPKPAGDVAELLRVHGNATLPPPAGQPAERVAAG